LKNSAFLKKKCSQKGLSQVFPLPKRQNKAVWHRFGAVKREYIIYSPNFGKIFSEKVRKAIKTPNLQNKFRQKSISSEDMPF
jgi:hypothetical protein